MNAYLEDYAYINMDQAELLIRLYSKPIIDELGQHMETINDDVTRDYIKLYVTNYQKLSEIEARSQLLASINGMDLISFCEFFNNRRGEQTDIIKDIKYCYDFMKECPHFLEKADRIELFKALKASTKEHGSLDENNLSANAPLFTTRPNSQDVVNMLKRVRFLVEAIYIGFESKGYYR